MFGYDEELLPTGYEDLDIMHRNGTNRKRIQAATEIGEAIPNDPTSKSYAMGSFKLKYTTCASSMTWGDMEKKNKRIASSKLSRGIVIRNTTEAWELKEIGLPTCTIFELDKVGCATLMEAPAWEPAASKKLKMGVFNVTIVTAGAHCVLPNGNIFSTNNILTNLVKEGAAGIRQGVGYNRVYMYDLRSFHDPHSSKKLRRHVGFHPEIIKGLVHSDSPDFLQWLMRVRDELLNALLNDKHPPVFVFYCKSGRHRSVAASEIVKYCLEQDNRMRIHVWHFAQQFWHRSTCEGRCKVCRNNIVTPALRLSANFWRNHGVVFGCATNE